MITFARLLEALSKDQRRQISTWMRGISQPARRKLSNHAMGEDDTIYLPLEHKSDPNVGQIHPEVAKHLEAHGHKIASFQDYKAGMAVDPHNRMVKIGKALQKTGAPDHLINTFANDPQRSTKSSPAQTLSVAITRDPVHVASMSTGRGWSSCMTLPDHKWSPHSGGEYFETVAEDLRQGTHVAYLIHAHDKKITNPIARVALKPFNKMVSGNNDEIDKDHPHTVLRPESSAYGTDAGGALLHTARKWTETHFPMHEDAIYKKHSKLYDDDNRNTLTKPSDETIHKIASSENSYKVDKFLDMASSHVVNEKMYHKAVEVSAPASTFAVLRYHHHTPDHISEEIGKKGLHRKNGEPYDD